MSRRPRLVDVLTSSRCLNSVVLPFAVVGGGLAGLAAAIECADGGADVTLYEARQRLGGATFSVERKGHWIDNGQHILLRCCVSYASFLHRLGVERLVQMQPRFRLTVLATGSSRRSSAARIFRRRSTSCRRCSRYAPLRMRERAPSLRAAAALRKLDPDDPDARHRHVRRVAPRPRPVRPRDRDALEPDRAADDERPRGRGVARAGRAGLPHRAVRLGRRAADIGISTVPLQQLHGDAAAAVLEAAGARIVARRAGARSSASSARCGRPRGRRRDDDAVIVAVPHNAAAGLLPPGAVDPAALAALGTARSSTCTFTTTGACSASRSRPRSTRPSSGFSTDRGLRRRDGAAGRPSRSPTRAPRSASRSRRSASASCRRSTASFRRRATPRCSTSRSTREPRATFRAVPGTRAPAARHAHRASGPLPRRRVDRHRLAGDDGGRGPQRRRRRTRRARPTSPAEPRRARRPPRERHRFAAPRRGAGSRSTRGRDRLLSLQHPDGWWKGELETNVTIDAEDLFLRFHLGILEPRPTDATARWIRSKQRDDGTWATFFGGPADCRRPSRPTSPCGSPATRRTPTTCAERRRSSVRRAASRRPASSRGCGCRCSASGRGTDVPVIPPEQILFPPRAPL